MAQPLLLRRAKQLLDEGLGDAVGVVAGLDDQEVDGTDESAGRDRRSKGEHRPTHDVSLRLGDDDTGLRQVDELAQEVRGVERLWPASIGPPSLAQGDDPVDVGDTGVLGPGIPRRRVVPRRAGGPSRSIGVSSRRFGRGPRCPSSARERCDARDALTGAAIDLLQSDRRWL